MHTKAAALSQDVDYVQKYPVRIAHIIGKMRNGGVEAVVINYYRNIDRSKVQYDFIIDEDSPYTVHQERITDLGGRLIKIPPYQKQLEYQKKLYRLFTENHYTLVYSHINTLSVFPLFAAYRAGVPIRIAHNHSTAGEGEFARNVMKYSLRPFAKLFPTHLCACSRFAGEWMYGKSEVESGHVIIWQNALDTKRFAYNESLRNETRRALNIQDKLVVGHAGRFMNQKNHNFLIDVFAEIHKRRNDSVLLLAGEGPLMEAVIEKVNRLGLSECVIFIGSVNDMERYYNAMDLFIFPSFYEGLGMSSVEAQISGLPVICSDRVPDEAAICENIKFLSLKKTASEWADEALRLSENHIRKSMATEAIKHGFDIKTQAAKMNRWYCELLKIPC